MGIICFPCGDPGPVELETALNSKNLRYYGLSKSSQGDPGAVSFTVCCLCSHVSRSLLGISEVGFGRFICCSGSCSTYSCYTKKNPKHSLCSVFIHLGMRPESLELWGILQSSQKSGKEQELQQWCEWEVIKHRYLTNDVCLCWSHSVAQICKRSQAHTTWETLYPCQNTPNKNLPAYSLPSQQTMQYKSFCFIIEVDKSEMIHIPFQNRFLQGFVWMNGDCQYMAILGRVERELSMQCSIKDAN